MTTHSTVLGCGTSLSEFYLEPFANRDLRIFTHSSWMAARQETIAKIIEATLQRLPFAYGLFGRYVGEDGKVSEREPNKGLLNKIHKVTALPTGAGWVVPNPLNILFDLVCGSIESGRSTVYMLSGQSMYRYVTQPYRHFGAMDALISTLYDAVRDYGFSDLPEHLNVAMVPVPVVRNFVAPLRLKDQLDRKLKCCDRVMVDNARCGKKLSNGQLPHALMRRLKQKRGRLFDAIAQPLLHVCADSETGTFYSQHDMDRDQDTIYIPDRVMALPIRAMLNSATRMGRLSA
jgi:hypothetical protein